MGNLPNLRSPPFFRFQAGPLFFPPLRRLRHVFFIVQFGNIGPRAVHPFLQPLFLPAPEFRVYRVTADPAEVATLLLCPPVVAGTHLVLGPHTHIPVVIFPPKPNPSSDSEFIKPDDQLPDRTTSPALECHPPRFRTRLVSSPLSCYFSSIYSSSLISYWTVGCFLDAPARPSPPLMEKKSFSIPSLFSSRPLALSSANSTPPGDSPPATRFLNY